MNAEIVAIGSELLTPNFQDSNSLFLTEQLNQLGIEVVFKTIVGDDRERLTLAARAAISRVDVVIFMGGLGPTEDDLTRECVAAALGREVCKDPAIITALYKRFAELRRTMPAINERQAEVIDGGVILPNAYGTAPGQWIEVEHEGRKRYLMLLPGPPHEIKPMFQEQCLPRLRQKAPHRPMALRVLKIAMMPESECDMRAAPIYTRYPEVQTTILASGGEIQLRLQAHGDSSEDAESRVNEVADVLEDEFGESIFSSGGETLEQIVGYYLQMRGSTLVVAESCTGGLLAQRITMVNGSSRYFLGGAIVYSNDLKTLFTNIPPLMIAQYGAVSREVAAALAEGIRDETGATFGVSITGIAGPGGGTLEKPVGLVYHGLADAAGTDVVEQRFPGDRERIRRFATQQALDMIRRKLL